MVFFQSIENGRHLRTLMTSMAVQKNLLLSDLRAATFSHNQDPERTWEPARGAGSLPPRRRAESFDEKIKENAQLGEAVASGRIDR